MGRVDLPEVAAGRCHVWWARPSDVSETPVGLLSGPERARAARFVDAADARRFVTARMLARVVVAGYLGRRPYDVRFSHRCRGCGGPHGKPEIEGATAGLRLSWSHAGDHVVLAVACAPVGVDVEPAGRLADARDMTRAVLHPTELRALAAIPPSRRAAACLRYWVRKEAIVKATGEGLSRPIDRLEVSTPDDPPRLLSGDGIAVERVRLHDLRLRANAVGCVAVLDPAPVEVREHDGAPLLRLGASMGGRDGDGTRWGDRS